MKTESERSFWRIATIVFAVIVVANYFPVLSGKIPFPNDLVLVHQAYADWPRPEPSQKVTALSDLIAQHYPFRSLTARAMSEGTLPLWNPYILAGAPFQANFQSSLFYPFNFLYDLLSPSTAWTVCLLIRMFMAASFMGLLMRSIGATTTGSIVSGIVFATSGFITAWQGYPIGDAAIWLPMICYTVIRLHRRRSGASITLAAFSFAMPILAGHPETAFHLAMTGVALAVWLLLFTARGEHRAFDYRFFVSFAIVGVLAVGLASIQLLPGLEWLDHMGKDYGVAWPALSRHDGQGFLSRDMRGFPNSAGLLIPEAAAYVGMLTLLAAPFALFHASRRSVFFFAAIAVAAASVAYSVEPAHWLVAHTPILKAIKNGRLILVAGFGITVLAGLGISVLEEALDKFVSRIRILAFGLLAVPSLAAILGIYKLHLATLSPVDWSRGPAATLVFLILAVALLLTRLYGTIGTGFFRTAATGLAALELVTFSYGFTGFARTSDIYPAAPVFDFLRKQGDPATFRIAKAGYPISANAGIMYNIQMAEGYDICTERTKTFCRDLTEDRDDGIFFLADKVAQASDRRLDMLNVKYFVVISPSPEMEEFRRRPDRFDQVYHQGKIAVFENKGVLPRAFAAPQSGIVVVDAPSEQLARVKNPSFDPLANTIFEEEPSSRSRVEQSSASFESRIELTASNVNGYSFQSRTSDAAVFVLSQTYYPGWEATIDGNPVPVYAVNYGLSGILSPAGNHKIEFFFRPRSFRVGLILTVLSLAVAAILSWKHKPT